MKFSPGFDYSNGHSSEITTAKISVEEKRVFEKYATIYGKKVQKYHAENDALNTVSVALVLNIKTGYISAQLHIVFDDDFTTTSMRITNKLPDNWDDIFKTIVNCHQRNSSSA